MKKRETIPELIARTVIEYEQRMLKKKQETQVNNTQPQQKSAKKRKVKKAA